MRRVIQLCASPTAHKSFFCSFHRSLRCLPAAALSAGSRQLPVLPARQALFFAHLAERNTPAAHFSTGVPKEIRQDETKVRLVFMHIVHHKAAAIAAGLPATLGCALPCATAPRNASLLGTTPPALRPSANCRRRHLTHAARAPPRIISGRRSGW